MPFSLPAPLIKLLAVLVGLGAIILAIHLYGSSRYKTGVADERAVWERVVREQQAKLDAAQRAADQMLAATRERDQAAIAESRKELEDAVDAIPDQGTTDRQRTRACLLLRRAGTAPPACDADPSG